MAKRKKKRVKKDRITEQQLRRYRNLLRSEEVQKYLDDDNINSVGLGYATKDGKEKLCIQFTVDRKITIEPEQPESMLDEALEAAKTQRIPKRLGKDRDILPTDVVQRTFSESFRVIPEQEVDARKQKQDPVSPGISVSHKDGTAGTLGCIVYDRNTGAPFVLSNWHVLRGSNGAIGDTIVQPGPYDDDTPGNQLGRLVRSHLGLSGDCAISSIETRDHDPAVYDLDIIPSDIARVELNDTVVKSGRTTSVTYGIVRRIEVTVKLNYSGGITEKIGCFEIGPDPDYPAPSNEISMGGDSGSCWLIRNPDGSATSTLVGLHFAGESSSNPDEYALACNIHSVLRKLDVTLTRSEEAVDGQLEVVRHGYNTDFLSGHDVPFPWLVRNAASNVYEEDGWNVIDYHHFSLLMHRERCMAIYTAHNIDGLRVKRVSRSGIRWRLDSRLPNNIQIGESAYENNPWDRGHLVRRAAVVWGTLAEARRANIDSFHYTNAVPQHMNFNRDEWVHLEDWVLDRADENNYRACVFTGPVFTPQDTLLDEMRIPAAFWKVIVVPISGNLRVTSFLMNQYQLLHNRNGARYIDLRVYQVSLETIEHHANIGFAPHLKEAQPQPVIETLAVPEGVDATPWSLVANPEDILI